MCLLITAIVPKTALAAGLDDVVARHRAHFDTFRNPHASSFLAAGEVQGTMTRGTCDCGSSLGTAAHRSDDHLARSVAKLRRKGWGEAKIRGWIESTEPGAARVVGRSASEWADLIDDVVALDSRGRGHLGLVLHWYRDDVTTEDLGALGRVRSSTTELRSPSFKGLEFDVVHEFVSGA